MELGSITDRGRENAIPRKRRKLNDSQPLCEACRALKLDRSFRRARDFFESARQGLIPRPTELFRENPDGPLFYNDCFLVHRFKDRLSVQSDCTLCQFFRSLRTHPGQYQNYKLLAFCSSESPLFCLPRLKESDVWNQVKHTVFAAVVPDFQLIPQNGHEEKWLELEVPAVGSIFYLPPPSEEDSDADANALLRARNIGNNVDLDVVREWMAFCDQYHDKECKKWPEGDPVERGFRVIDCHADPPVVLSKPWGTRYVALSYCWGRAPEDIVDWPKTVLDAVAVTKELGMQYLWVDRLCIAQQDIEEKMYLIGKMTMIYSAADLTIVAAAGTGAGQGLPGIRTTPRSPQPRFNLERGSALVSSLRDPRLDIRESEWSSRGWTYQEGVLSKRRLIFTESQAYWECRCMAIHESIRLPLGAVHEPDGKRMADFMLGGIFKGEISMIANGERSEGLAVEPNRSPPEYGFDIVDQDSVYTRLRELDNHIRAFSERNLSFEGDSLAAFEGIKGLYLPENQIQLLSGIPVWTARIGNSWSGLHISFAMAVSMWYHNSSSHLRMFVSEARPRRTQFPSWSWGGWQGTVSWYLPPNEEHALLLHNLIAKPKKVDLLWAANLYLHSAVSSVELRLCDPNTGIWNHDYNIVEIRNAYILNYYCTKEIDKQWSWIRLAGRQGRDQYNGGNMGWDTQWQRLAGRLVCIGISLSMTQDEWSAKHTSQELISILIFAGRDPESMHGRARFVTLRRAASVDGVEHWERVGIVQLIASKPELATYRNIGDLLRRLPIKPSTRNFLIQ